MVILFEKYDLDAFIKTTILINKRYFIKKRSFWFLFYAFLKIFSLFVLKTNYCLEKPLMLSGQKELLFLEERKKMQPPCLCGFTEKNTPSNSPLYYLL